LSDAGVFMSVNFQDKYSGFLPTECWVEYLDVWGRKWPENGRNCT